MKTIKISPEAAKLIALSKAEGLIVETNSEGLIELDGMSLVYLAKFKFIAIKAGITIAGHGKG